MEKIKLKSIKTPVKSSTILLKSSGAALIALHAPSEPAMLSIHFNGEDVYSFSGDIDRVEKIIEWLYDNTTGRFTFLGTENIYFESSEDAMAFKLRWM